MIKLKKENKRAKEEEEKKEEEGIVDQPKTQKKCPGELRLQKEIQELDIPGHAKVSFPNPDDIMSFRLVVDLSREQCIWQGGKYEFSIEVSPNYPHDAPKCLCLT